MLTQKHFQDTYEKAVKEAIGVDTDSYNRKMDWLKKRWEKEMDGEAFRLIAPIVLNKTTPLNVSILADNLDYFKTNYKNGGCQATLETALEKACLSGSQRVAEFILQNLKSNYTATEHQHLLGHIAASMNDGWTKEVARTLAKAHVKMPLSVYGLGHSDNIIDEINHIFTEFKSQGKETPRI